MKPRRVWVAALLCLLGGPVGQVYAGHFRRGVVLWSLGVCLLTIIIISIICLPLGRTGAILMLLSMLVFPLYVAVDAVLLVRKNRNSPLKRYQRLRIYLLVSLVFVLANNAVAHVIKSFVAESFVIPSFSMSPTILPGDRILADKWSFKTQGLKRNDLAIFYSDGPGSPLFVMRVVGLPGDEIEIIDEQVIVNGENWPDTQAVFEGPIPRRIDMPNYSPTSIPIGRFFVLGDNRRKSLDSRFIGLIPLTDLHGKARVIYWSRSREFPDPYDRSNYIPGNIQWERIGMRLD